MNSSATILGSTLLMAAIGCAPATADQQPADPMVSNAKVIAEDAQRRRESKAAQLSAEEQQRFDAGKGIYEQVCLACHQAHGLGLPGLAPPLADSEWVAGSEGRIIRIVLHGMRGKLKVKGEEYERDMPSLGVLEDEQVASVLTYVRREWGHTFPAVSPETVKQVRKETEAREEAWTMGELLKIP